MNTLFEANAPRPLADRLRPQKLADVVGQDHLLKGDGPIARMTESGKLSSIVFWGAPGTGKTTTSVSLAAGLAARGQRVLLIDTDFQGNVAGWFGVKSERSLYHVLVMGLAPKLVAQTIRENLNILPANETLAAAELYLAGRRSRHTVLAERLGAAHLVIGRAGASTVAELAAAGRPGLLVPLPASIDDHQMANAQRLVDAGGGWLMPQSALTPEALAERLYSLLANPALLARASRCAQASARTSAAEHLADLVCGLNDDNGDGRISQGEAAA